VNKKLACSFLIALVAIISSSVALAACGDSDDSNQQVSFNISGEKGSAAIAGPDSADAGVTEITYVNETDGPADLQLVRIEGEHSPDEVAKAFDAPSTGAPLEDWMFAAGGVGSTQPGQSQSVTQNLEPGNYYAFNTEGRSDASLAATFDVEGNATDEKLTADASIETFEYGFKPVDVKSGDNQVLFKNIGTQLHHIIYSPITGDATVADIKEYIKTESGPPPFNFDSGSNTAVLEGGTEQLVNLELKPGRYALICFVSDREGGPPHALKGMVGELDVK